MAKPDNKPAGVLGLTKTSGHLKLEGQVMDIRPAGNFATVGVGFWKNTKIDVNIPITKDRLNGPKKIKIGSDVVVSFTIDKSKPIKLK